MIVLDASIGVKWFLHEADSVEADALFKANRGAITVPGLFWIEVASALVRTANTGKERAPEMQSFLDDLAVLAFGNQIAEAETSISHWIDAATIGIAIGHPLKDCLYLALAMELGCPLVTADARFVVKAREVWGEVQVLGA
jgi:predicted nucleic acid-binding protein